MCGITTISRLKSRKPSKLYVFGGQTAVPSQLINNIKKGYETRNKEAKIICDSLNNYHGPIIIAGDLNDISGSKTLYTLQKEINLNDAWWKSGFGYGITSFSKHLYFRLDHILFSHHFKSTSINIPKVDFSDHYPIVTNLEIQ